MTGGAAADDRGSASGSTPAARWREAGLVLALFAVLTVGMTWPQARHPGFVADLGDPLLSVWRLAWVAHQVPRDPGHLFDANIFYPERHTLAYSDAMLGPGLAAAPLAWAGVHPVHVYTIVLLSAFALSGAAMYALVRSLTGSRLAGVVSGVLFAFCPYRFDHYSHLELQCALFMPLALLALHRAVDGADLRSGVAAGAAFSLQALCSVYYGIFFACFLAPVAAVLVAGGRRVWKTAAVLLAGAALAAACLLPVLRPYLSARQVLGGRTPAEIAEGSATVRSYVVTSDRIALYRGVLSDARPQTDERRLFPGLVAVILAAIGLWPPWSRGRLAYAAGLLVAIDLTLGLNGGIYPFLHAWLLPFRGLRVPARAGIVVACALSVLAGYGLTRVLGRLPSSSSTWLGPLVATLVASAALVECRPSLALEPVWMRPPSVYGWFRGQPPAVIMEVPSESDATGALAEMKDVYFSVFHWQELLTGSSGFFPPSHAELTRVMRVFPDEASLGYLRRRGATYLVLHGALCDPVQFQATSAWLVSQPGVRLLGGFPWEGSESRLFALQPRPTPAAGWDGRPVRR